MSLCRAFAPVAVCVLLAWMLPACQRRPAFAGGADDAPEACEARKRELLAFVQRLPERTLQAGARTELPVSSLGGVPGAGPVLQVSEANLLLDGTILSPAVWHERAATLAPDGSLYVAAAPDVTMGTLRTALAPLPTHADVKLLVRMPGAAPVFAAGSDVPARARELAERLRSEREPARQRELAARGYAEFSACGALEDSLSRVGAQPAAERWPALKREFAAAVPHCSCDSLDAPALRAVLAAEQRAGTATLGALPLSFARDVRCSASMPLRSVQRLLQQMEKFDADNAGRYQDDAIRFEQVITNERLREQFCDSLPGETLAALAKARATLFVRAPDARSCEPIKLAPLSPGAPMGTLRRSGGPSFHYWQAAEELGVFGPAGDAPPTKPTDEREWGCRVNHRLVGIDQDSIELERGRWFFTETACRAAPALAAAELGCVPAPESKSAGTAP